MFFGYQAVYDADFLDAIDYAADNRFDYVSFDLNVPRFYIDGLDGKELDRIRRYSEAKGLSLAFHAPGDNISLFSDYPAIRNGILEHFSAIIKAAERLGARHVTVHPGSYPSLKQAEKRNDDFIEEHGEYFYSVLYDNLMQLADQTDRVLLCVENADFTPLTMSIVEKLLPSGRLFLTWDIAKTYDKEIRVNDAVESFMQVHAEQVREIHVHDIIKGFRSHQIVGSGGIDFGSYSALMQRPDVAVTVEVRPREAAKVSRDNLLEMLRKSDGGIRP